MGIHQKSTKIDIAQIRELSKLEGDFLVERAARDAELAKIITGKDSRILLVIGPCSSDNEEATLEYASRLAKLRKGVKDKIFIVMRAYTTKPRTNGDGYKGLMHRPGTSKLPDLVNGIVAVRHLHYRVITKTGLTTADEMLYPANLLLVDDLVSYHAIDARSVEDQEHRFVASGIDVPTGMKNPTLGNLNVMLNDVYAAQSKQNFTYHNAEVDADGNPLAHAILRGTANKHGRDEPNYYYDDLLKATELYEKAGLENPFIIADTNHDNSGKNYLKQIRIVRQTLINRNWNNRINKYVRGFMIESYPENDRQGALEVSGKSITDPCPGWEETEQLIREIHTTLSHDSFEESLF